jgi:biopolymer transport protein TolR
MTGTPNGDDLNAEINVTPLVDVVLVLLVVLMVMTPFLKEELPVEIPIAAHAREEATNPPPELTIAADGSISFEGTPLPSDDLESRLATIYSGRADKTLMLAADRTLPYARVVEVMDACRGAGVERIGVVTAPPPRPPAMAEGIKGRSPLTVDQNRDAVP